MADKDRIQPLKIESPDSGGDEVDMFPTALDKNEDYIDCRGTTYQNSISNDGYVYIDRDEGDNLVFSDGYVDPITLTQILESTSGVTEAKHKILRHLIHFIDEGPAEGFASGAYKETLPSGDPFPTSFIWWESSDKLKKIIEETITYNTNKTIATDTWKMYDTDGFTVLATVSDTILYSGVFETSRTRIIS